MSSNQLPSSFEDSPKQVASGFGYPNHREAESEQPTGWVRSPIEDLVHVSRETSTDVAEIRRTQL